MSDLFVRQEVVYDVARPVGIGLAIVLIFIVLAAACDSTPPEGSSPTTVTKVLRHISGRCACAIAYGTHYCSTVVG